MQDFGQPFFDPLDDPLEDPMGDPFDLFADPFEAMFNALGSGLPGNPGILEPLATTNFQEPLADQGNLNMDNLGGMLDSLEETIENSPPIPPALEIDGLDTILSALENNIENTSIPPELETEVELFNDPGWESTPSIDTSSPPLSIYDSPVIQPTRGHQPVSRQRGTNRTKMSTNNKTWCPLENDYISPEACDGKECEHYNADVKDCTYYNKGQAGM